MTPKGSGNGNGSDNGSVRSLGESVRDAMEQYFSDLEGHEPAELYELFMSQVEKPFFETVMTQTGGNLSRAAEMLGLNRSTLRSRLRKYELTK